MNFNVLVVDDEKNIRDGLARALKLDNYNLFTAENGKEALSIIDDEDIDLVISDLKMPEMSGEDLLKEISSRYPTIPVIILTGHGTIENAVNAMRDGAFDFLTKPLNLDRLSLLAKRALSNRELVLQHRQMKDELERLNKKQKYKQIIGKSSKMMSILETVDQVASTKASALITGESGVGKELIADAIHHLSNRADKPFIKVHCAALSESLLESELFGHEKGAFTGAVQTKKGRFELADGGTIFLDEIGEINQNIQIKILRVLQEKTFERVGGEKTLEVDVRIVSATNRDLKSEIEKGNFREDLYYRLNVVNIHVPPLKERKDDIPLLVSAFIEDLSKENGKNVEGIEQKALSLLYNYTWPGNIRELRNCIESAVVMTKNSIIQKEDLPPFILESEKENSLILPLGASMAEIEKEAIIQTLHFYQGNKSKTAEQLQIGRKTLHRKINEYGINL